MLRTTVLTAIALAAGSPAQVMPPRAETAVEARQRSMFEGLEIPFAEYRGMKLDDVRRLKSAHRLKQDANQSLVDHYSAVADLGSTRWTIASLVRIGEVNADFARKIIASPAPPGLGPKQLAEYRAQLETRGFALQQAASKALDSALQLAIKLGLQRDPFALEARTELDRLRAR